MFRLARLSLPAVVLVLLVPAATVAQDVFPTKKEREIASLLDAEHVTARTRALLRGKMKSHGGDMRDLTVAVALLRYDAAKQIAQRIANQPRVDRSAEGSKPDGVDLTPAFFAFQDALKKNATELAETADRKDHRALSASMAKTIDTCMSCHALFLPSAKAADAGK
jgi:hypothetical protein